MDWPFFCINRKRERRQIWEFNWIYRKKKLYDYHSDKTNWQKKKKNNKHGTSSIRSRSMLFAKNWKQTIKNTFLWRDTMSEFKTVDPWIFSIPSHFIFDLSRRFDIISNATWKFNAKHANFSNLSMIFQRKKQIIKPNARIFHPKWHPIQNEFAMETKCAQNAIAVNLQ